MRGFASVSPSGRAVGTSARQTDRRKLRTGFIAVLVLLIMLMALAVWLSKTSGTEGAGAKLGSDLKLLWGWSDSVLQGGAASAQWSFRWDASFDGEQAAQSLIAELFVDEAGAMMAKEARNDGRSVSSRQTGYFGAELKLSAHMAEQSAGGATLIVLLESDGGSRNDQSLAKLAAATGHISTLIGGEAQSFEAGMKASGYARHAGGAADAERMAQGQLREKYEDGGSRIATLYSALLKSSARVGQGREANMQIASHHNTESGDIELTIGIPLISGEIGSGASFLPD